MINNPVISTLSLVFTAAVEFDWGATSASGLDGVETTVPTNNLLQIH